MKNSRLPVSIIILFLASQIMYAQEIGEEQEVTAINHLRAQASWDGCSAGRDENTATYNPPPGWVIVEYKTQKHSESNGSSSVSIIEKDLNFTAITEWSRSFDDLIDLASKRNEDEIKAKLQQKKSEYSKFYHQIQSNKNTIYAKVKAKAHGSCFDRKRGWSDITVKATLRYVGTSQDVKNEIQDLKNRYNLTE